jgi:hypothetical protein
LDHILQRVLFPQLKINISNMAFPATPSNVQAKSHFSVLIPAIKTAHIVLVDITANDGNEDSVHIQDYEGRLLMELLLQYSSPRTAVIYMETFNRYWLLSPIVVRPGEINQCSGNKSMTFHYNRHFIGAPLMHSRCDDKTKLDVATYFHWCPLLELQIPVISYVDIMCRYSDAVWRNKIDQNFLWGSRIHPSIKVHMFIAQVVGLSILELYRETIDGPNYKYPSNAMSAEVKQWDRYIRAHPLQGGEFSDTYESRCSAVPTTRLPDVPGQPFEPLSAGPEWFHGEDVKGKPGWIAQAVATGNDTHIETRREIRFGLNISPYNGRGIAKLELLSSYGEDMGVLSCCVNCDGAAFTPTVTIDTKIEEHTSQTFVTSVPFLYNHKRKDTSNISHSILRCRANAGKVKIVTVIGC